MPADDPLKLGGLSGSAIGEAVAASKIKPTKPPSEHEMKKEERLQSKEVRMRQGGVPAAASAAAPAQPKPVDKSALLDKIIAYRERFTHLKKRNTCTVKSSAEDLQDELHYIELQLGSAGGNAGMGASLMVAAAAGLESFTKDVYNPLGLNLAGLSNLTRDNTDQFVPIIDELIIKYGIGMHVGPEMRLAGTFATLIYTCHVTNQGDPRLAAALSKLGQQAPSKVDKDL
jgi:hypothetical protein